MPAVRITRKLIKHEAIQWLPETKDDVLAWLADNNMQYTFHEINSAGKLIVYTSTGPSSLEFGHWIVKSEIGTSMILNPDEFNASWEPV